MAAFGFAGTLVDRSGAAIVCFIASLTRALLVAGAGVALHLVPPGAAETVTVMALAAVTLALDNGGDHSPHGEQQDCDEDQAGGALAHPA
ncbi:hypothetical protein AB0K74_35640, partial [Streptomyces sp. NPDC056159]